jgi:hypothetical protein
MFDYVYLGKFTWVSDYNYTGISCFENDIFFTMLAVIGMITS